jgi:hypothetical protein
MLVPAGDAGENPNPQHLDPSSSPPPPPSLAGAVRQSPCADGGGTISTTCTVAPSWGGRGRRRCELAVVFIKLCCSSSWRDVAALQAVLWWSLAVGSLSDAIWQRCADGPDLGLPRARGHVAWIGRRQSVYICMYVSVLSRRQASNSHDGCCFGSAAIQGELGPGDNGDIHDNVTCSGGGTWVSAALGGLAWRPYCSSMAARTLLARSNASQARRGHGVLLLLCPVGNRLWWWRTNSSNGLQRYHD